MLLWLCLGGCASTSTQDDAFQTPPPEAVLAPPPGEPSGDFAESWLGRYAGVAKRRKPSSVGWSQEGPFKVVILRDPRGGLSVSFSAAKDNTFIYNPVMRVEHVDSFRQLSGEVASRISQAKPVWKYSFAKFGDKINGTVEVNPEPTRGTTSLANRGVVYEFRVDKTGDAAPW